jgi:hypothetical protein
MVSLAPHSEGAADDDTVNLVFPGMEQDHGPRSSGDGTLASIFYFYQ